MLSSTMNGHGQPRGSFCTVWKKEIHKYKTIIAILLHLTYRKTFNAMFLHLCYTSEKKCLQQWQTVSNAIRFSGVSWYYRGDAVASSCHQQQF